MSINSTDLRWVEIAVGMSTSRYPLADYTGNFTELTSSNGQLKLTITEIKEGKITESTYSTEQLLYTHNGHPAEKIREVFRKQKWKLDDDSFEEHIRSVAYAVDGNKIHPILSNQIVVPIPPYLKKLLKEERQHRTK